MPVDHSFLCSWFNDVKEITHKPCSCIPSMWVMELLVVLVRNILYCTLNNLDMTCSIFSLCLYSSLDFVPTIWAPWPLLAHRCLVACLLNYAVLSAEPCHRGQGCNLLYLWAFWFFSAACSFRSGEGQPVKRAFPASMFSQSASRMIVQCHSPILLIHSVNQAPSSGTPPVNLRHPQPCLRPHQNVHLVVSKLWSFKVPFLTLFQNHRFLNPPFYTCKTARAKSCQEQA